MGMKNKELLFSVTKKDCILKYYRGSGGGGQKKNKTDNCCQCTHKESGAQASSEQGRSKEFNTKNAFKKMTETLTFKNWMKIEISRKNGDLIRIENKVDKELKTNVKIEGKDKNGKWVNL